MAKNFRKLRTKMSPRARIGSLEKARVDAAELISASAEAPPERGARFRTAVREGIAQADRGEFIEEEEMDAMFEQMLRPDKPTG